jgi:hypothetical protein
MATSRRNPFQRDVCLALVGKRDLGLLNLHRERMAALFVDDLHQPIEQVRFDGFLANLTDIRDHARFVYAVDVRPWQ